MSGSVITLMSVAGLGCDNVGQCQGAGWVCVQGKCDCGIGYIRESERCVKVTGKEMSCTELVVRARATHSVVTWYTETAPFVTHSDELVLTHCSRQSLPTTRIKWST
jgi:hypothetical protein